MRHDIDTYIQAIEHDNREFIINSNMTVAEYILDNAENTHSYYEYFDDDELEKNHGEPTKEQIREFRQYMLCNYNHFPGEE